MAFGKTKKEICGAWSEVGHAAFTVYTLLCCYRFDQTGACESFSWTEIADALGMTSSNIANIKKILFQRGWLVEVDRQVYPVKGFESELTALGFDLEKFTSRELPTSHHVKSDNKKFTWRELSAQKSSRHVNSDNEKSSYHVNKKFIPRELLDVHIRNSEITEKNIYTSQTDGLGNLNARTHDANLMPPDSPAGNYFSSENFLETRVDSGGKIKVILTESEKRMPQLEFYEHLAQIFPHLENPKQTIGKCFAWCKKNQKPAPNRLTLKQWLYDEIGGLSPPDLPDELLSQSSSAETMANAQQELEAKLEAQRIAAKNFYKNHGNHNSQSKLEQRA